MADTIVIETPVATVLEVSGKQGPQGPAGAAGATGPQGPQGVPGTGLEVLTTQGDLLYQGAETGQRLAIGTAGQILKVSAGGIPEWGAAPATGVTSVTGTAPITSSGGNTPTISISAATTSAAGSMSAADKTKLDGIASGAEVNVNADWNASSGDAQILNKPTIPSASYSTPSALGTAAAGSSANFARADHVHAMPSASDLSLGSGDNVTFNSVDASSFNAEEGPDSVLVDATGILFGGQALANTRANLELGTAATADIGTGAGDVCAGDDARLSDSRTPTTHAASHAAAGSDPLELADLAATGSGEGSLLVGDGGGAVAWLDGQAWAAQNITSQDIGAASSDHTHGNLTNDGKVGSTAGLPLVTTTAGAVTTLALGTANQVLRVNSGATGVEFADPSGGGVTSAAASASDVLGVSGSNITGVDAGSADRLVFWDDSASKLTYAATTGGTFDGTTLRWPVELVIACSDESTDLTTGTAKVTFRAPYAFLLTGVRASVNTAPTGSTLIVDINNGANSALSTKLSIDASEKTSTTAATAAVIDTSYDDFSDDAEITIDIDQIGSTVAGKGLKVTLIGTRA